MSDEPHGFGRLFGELKAALVLQDKLNRESLYRLEVRLDKLLERFDRLLALLESKQSSTPASRTPLSFEKEER